MADAAHLVAPPQENYCRAVVRQRAGDDEHVEYLVAVAGEVEPPRLPPFRHPRHVEGGARQVSRRHGRLVGQRHVAPRFAPVDDGRVQGGYDPEEAHPGEERGAVSAEFPGGELGGEEGEDGDEAHGGDGNEVGELPVSFTLEDVVDRGKEGSDDHDGDSGVVNAEEEEVEAARVATEQVARAA